MEQMRFDLQPRYIKAVAHVKAMRGGAQSHLLSCDDGNRYIVKFQNNPQGTRILANEWIAAAVFHYVGIATPAVVGIQVDEAFLAANPEVSFRLGTRRVAIHPGIHFGSLYVGTDHREPYEFLPDALLGGVNNQRDFIGTLAVDKWLENADSRQCVFLKADTRGFKVWMIDHGYILNGPNWDLGGPVDRCGLYPRPMVYDGVTETASFDPWLNTIEHCPFRVFSDALESMPAEWLTATEADKLRLLLRQVWQNRRSLRNRLVGVCSRLSQTFPRWQQLSVAA